MRIGTKSLLFGAHQFALHPIFVAAAWWKLYGAPLDPRLWIAFFVHDLGYFGKPNIDGPEGKTHPEFGAQIMKKLFGNKWGELCRYHSRSMARDHGREPSLLSHADKLATLLVPCWLYLLQVKATGEIHEYLQHFRERLESNAKHAIGLGVQNIQHPPHGIVYASVDHWYWAITRRYTPNWIQEKRRELMPQVQHFRLQVDNC